MSQKKITKTKGVALRIDEDVLAVYDRIALRATGIRLRNGDRHVVSAQDVMRHRLNSLPLVKGKNKDD